MGFFRNIIAVMLALVIASPLCCCANMSSKTVNTPSCCSSKKQDGKKNPTACHCSAKQAKDITKAIVTPTDLAVTLLPPVFEIHIPVFLPELETVPHATPQGSYDPPGHFLAKYSRWLI